MNGWDTFGANWITVIILRKDASTPVMGRNDFEQASKRFQPNELHCTPVVFVWGYEKRASKDNTQMMEGG